VNFASLHWLPRNLRTTHAWTAKGKLKDPDRPVEIRCCYVNVDLILSIMVVLPCLFSEGGGLLGPRAGGIPMAQQP